MKNSSFPVCPAIFRQNIIIWVIRQNHPLYSTKSGILNLCGITTSRTKLRSTVFVNTLFCPGYLFRFNVCGASGPFVSRFEFWTSNLVCLFYFILYFSKSLRNVAFKYCFMLIFIFYLNYCLCRLSSSFNIVLYLV